jgi:hypothetical protein
VQNAASLQEKSSFRPRIELESPTRDTSQWTYSRVTGHLKKTTVPITAFIRSWGSLRLNADSVGRGA